MEINKKQTFKRFLVSYVIIFAIPFIAIFFIYNNLLNIIEENCKDYNLNMLEQCKDLIEARMQEMNGIIVQLNNNSVLDNLMYQMNFNTGEASYYMGEIWKDISVFSLSNRFIYDFFIFNEKEDFLISPKSVITKLSQSYGYEICYGDLSFQQFKKQIMTKSNSKSFLPENLLKRRFGTKYDNEKVVGYTRSLPLNSDKPRGSISFFISISKIQDILKHMYSEEGGDLFIINSNGEVIMAYPEKAQPPSQLILSTSGGDRVKDIMVDGAKAVGYQIYSSYSDLIFVSVMPYSVVLKRVANIQGVLLLALFVMLFIGFSLSYLMAYKHSKPIIEAVGLLMSSVPFTRGVRHNDFDVLKDSITKLISNNKRLQKDINEKFVLLRNDFFGNLFRSSFTTKKEVEAYLYHINLHMPPPPYITFIIYFRGYSSFLNENFLRETSTIKLMLNQCLDEQFPDLIYSYDYDFDKVIVLLPISMGNMQLDGVKDYSLRKWMEDRMMNIHHLITKHFDVYLSIAVGKKVDDIMEVGDSVNTAIRALQSSTFTDSIKWYSDLPIHPIINYSIELEMKILQWARAGCYYEIETSLNHLFKSCFSNNHSSNIILKQLVSDLKGTVFQIAVNDLPQDSHLACIIYEFIDESDFCQPYDEVCNELLLLYEKICSYFNDQKRSHNTQMSNQIQDFILKNYNNPQLSLGSIASKFNISEVYASQFFKEQTGKNFSNYLEDIRIQAACNNLDNPNLSIQKIAELSGYTTAHTFRQAFKRVMGVSPTGYRKAKWESGIPLHD